MAERFSNAVQTTTGTESRIAKALREPLVQFLALGAGLFLLYVLHGDTSSAAPDRVVVDETDVARLTEQFQRTWMRPPTRRELEGLAEDFVKEEVLYREAVALGLDRDDLIIRRRMRQKMEFLNADLTEQAAPSDAELQAYLDANPEKFVRPDRVSFEQIYISPDRAGGDAEGRAAELLARIRADTALAADPQSLGDPTVLPPGLELAPAREIAGAFGSELAETIVQAGQGGWSGPHRSAYGLHLILVSDSEPGGMPALAEIRPVVEREWSNERRQEANDRFYQALRDRYSVEIHLPAEEDENGLAEPAR